MSKRDPDLTEKVIGFRYWSPENGWLGSQGLSGHYWGRGANEAKCEQHNRGGMLWGNVIAGSLVTSASSSGWSIYADPADAKKKPHLVPAHDCTCGLHAYHEPLEGLTGNGPFSGEAMHVLGAVKAWGRMEVHSNGFRAQYAEIIALSYNAFWPKGFVEVVQQIARSYEVDCVPVERLQAFALEQGSPVPPEHRPDFMPEPKLTSANPVKQQFLNYYQQQAAWQIRKGGFGV